MNVSHVFPKFHTRPLLTAHSNQFWHYASRCFWGTSDYIICIFSGAMYVVLTYFCHWNVTVSKLQLSCFSVRRWLTTTLCRTYPEVQWWQMKVSVVATQFWSVMSDYLEQEVSWSLPSAQPTDDCCPRDLAHRRRTSIAQDCPVKCEVSSAKNGYSSVCRF